MYHLKVFTRTCKVCAHGVELATQRRISLV